MDLDGHCVLVTGASRGIGRAIAVQFARLGARIAVAGRDATALEETRALCCTETMPLIFDVADEAACRAAVAECETGLGPLDCLVNNAGIAESATFLNTSTEFLRRIMRIDFESSWWLTQAALPGMLTRRQGTVLFISSTSAKIGFPLVSAYAAAKHAQLGLMRSLAVEYVSSGVTFNAICP